MPPTNEESSDRFTIICLHCDSQMVAQAAWVGREVLCPHCSQALRVPCFRGDGRPVLADPPQPTMERRFNFACPRCQSLLESHTGMCGRTGRCPTCNAQFVVPAVGHRRGAPQLAALLDKDDQDPTPMHAYAANGHQAPRICRRKDGTPLIECPRCGAHSDVSVNNCPNCGIPFTIDGVPTSSGTPGQSLAVTSLVLGICSIPLFLLFVLGPLAIIFGLASWLRRATPMPSGQATAGIILGTGSTLLTLWSFL
ncbi:MAG: hypothetical protein KAY37_07270 [Phycisphaerae bacterium]|nr:hypothetical protein [Phycisphaerae bacterium]